MYLLYYYENNAQDYFGTKTARLTRVTVTGDTASPASEVVLLGTMVGMHPATTSLPGVDCMPGDAPSHGVGAVKFASDGTLWVTVGDAAYFTHVNPDALRAQDLDSLAGKVLRITRTGQGLSTNPYWTGNASHNRSKVWAMGLRNAYRFNLRPGSNIPYLGDVGWDSWEEVSAAPAGANLGWPCYEGSAQQAGYSPNPVCQALYMGNPQQGGSLAGIGTPIAKVPASQGLGGGLSVIRDGDLPPVGSGDPARQYDSWDGGNSATEDWVGYTFATPQTFERVVFQEGMHFWDGGWFTTADGAGPAEQRVGGRGEPDESPQRTRASTTGRTSRRSHFDFTPIDGRRDPNLRGARGQPPSSSPWVSSTCSAPRGWRRWGPARCRSRARRRRSSRRSRRPGQWRATQRDPDGDMPPVGSDDSTRQYDSWNGANRRADDWVGLHVRDAPDVHPGGVPGGDALLGRRVVRGAADRGGAAGQQWVDVLNPVFTPAYPGNNGVSFQTFTVTFTPIVGDAIRLIGRTWRRVVVHLCRRAAGVSPKAMGSPRRSHRRSGSTATTARRRR